MRSNNLFKRIAAVCLWSLVTACATPQDARDKGAVATYISKKSAREVTDCIATAWENAYGHATPVNVRPTAEGYSLRIEVSGNTQIMVDVADTKDGSTSSYYKGNVIGGGRLINAIQPCQ